jgi:hypothetical protein
MKIIPWIFVAAGVVAIIAGRVATNDLTEGRALIAGWEYWAVAGVSFVCAFMLAQE